MRDHDEESAPRDQQHVQHAPAGSPSEGGAPNGAEDATGGGFTRRGFLKGAGMTVATVGLLGPVVEAQPTEEQAAGPTILGPGKMPIELTINGEKYRLEVAPSETFLDALRQKIGLTGAKRVCDRGSCGACTVLVDGTPVNGCSQLAVDMVGKSIRTVEGLAAGDNLTPLQQSFVQCDALQCGFCTPGMLMACTALLERNPKPSRAETKEALAGNLCRCGTYQNIFEAVDLASSKAGR